MSQNPFAYPGTTNEDVSASARLQELELNAGGELYSGAGAYAPMNDRLRAGFAAFEAAHLAVVTGQQDMAAALFRAARKLAQRAADRHFRSAALRRAR